MWWLCMCFLSSPSTLCYRLWCRKQCEQCIRCFFWISMGQVPNVRECCVRLNMHWVSRIMLFSYTFKSLIDEFFQWNEFLRFYSQSILNAPKLSFWNNSRNSMKFNDIRLIWQSLWLKIFDFQKKCTWLNSLNAIIVVVVTPAAASAAVWNTR